MNNPQSSFFCPDGLIIITGNISGMNIVISLKSHAYKTNHLKLVIVWTFLESGITIYLPNDQFCRAGFSAMCSVLYYDIVSTWLDIWEYPYQAGHFRLQILLACRFLELCCFGVLWSNRLAYLVRLLFRYYCSFGFAWSVSGSCES